MQRAGARDLVELLAQFRHPVADQPPVGLDLGLAGAAEEAEAAALALEVGPGPDQPPGLIVEMGELDLQPPLRGRRALAENLEDEAGAVDHLGLGPLLEILLLDRRDRGVDDEQLGLRRPDRVGDLLDLPRAEQGRGPRLADAELEPVLDRDPDRLGEARRLVEPRLGIAPRLAPEIGQGDDGARAARDFIVGLSIEDAQPLTPRPGPRRN